MNIGVASGRPNPNRRRRTPFYIFPLPCVAPIRVPMRTIKEVLS